jgi:hypothetical protein
VSALSQRRLWCPGAVMTRRVLPPADLGEAMTAPCFFLGGGIAAAGAVAAEQRRGRLAGRMAVVGVWACGFGGLTGGSRVACCRLKPGTWLRAIDFGCAQEVTEGIPLTRKTGTPMFMAPEVRSSPTGLDFGSRRLGLGG